MRKSTFLMRTYNILQVIINVEKNQHSSKILVLTTRGNTIETPLKALK